MSDNNGKFEMWMIVELFGHQQIAGKVSEQTVAGEGFVRVDVPKTSRREGFTKFYGPKAIYGMTPVSEEIAAIMAERLQIELVSEWQLGQALKNLLPASAVLEGDDVARSVPLPSWADNFSEYDDDLDDDDPEIDVPFFGDMPDMPELDRERAIARQAGISEDELPNASEHGVFVRSTPEPELDHHEQDKRAAAQWARDLLKEGFVILDTETTGLNKDRADEPVQIAVISSDGEVLLDTYVKSTIRSSEGAFGVHRISNEMLADAPTFGLIRPRLREAIEGKALVIYNAAYDLAILQNACKADDPKAMAVSDFPSEILCAMEMYAHFYGVWSSRHQSYTYQSLAKAVQQLGGKVSQAHTALGDCRMTLFVIQKMAGMDEHNS
jgi:DNA polymerase-3 subunit epsilon